MASTGKNDKLWQKHTKLNTQFGKATGNIVSLVLLL
jgi:hypothetical protein